MVNDVEKQRLGKYIVIPEGTDIAFNIWWRNRAGQYPIPAAQKKHFNMMGRGVQQDKIEYLSILCTIKKPKSDTNDFSATQERVFKWRFS